MREAPILRTLVLTVLALAVALAVAPAHAGECVPTTSKPEVDTNPAGAEGVPRLYFDNDLCQFSDDPCLFAMVLYEEWNGIDGLQRGGPYDWVDDTCGGAIAPDLMWG